NVTLVTDTGPTGSGNVGIGSGLLISYTTVGAVTAHGAGGQFKVDDTLITATTVSASDSGTPTDRVNQVTGDRGQTAATCDGFATLLVGGGTGSQTLTLPSIDGNDPAGAGVALTGVTLNGDNAAGTDTAADTLAVQTLPASVSATLLGGGGNDTF